jgi:GntP family gluconate:H+ symporter
MTAHDARLLLDAAAGIVLIVALITAARLHAFLALTIGSILVGLLAGHGAPRTILSFEAGVGGTLGYVGSSWPSAPCWASCSPTPVAPT